MSRGEKDAPETAERLVDQVIKGAIYGFGGGYVGWHIAGSIHRWLRNCICPRRPVTCASPPVPREAPRPPVIVQQAVEDTTPQLLELERGAPELELPTDLGSRATFQVEADEAPTVRNDQDGLVLERLDLPTSANPQSVAYSSVNEVSSNSSHQVERRTLGLDLPNGPHPPITSSMPGLDLSQLADPGLGSGAELRDQEVDLISVDSARIDAVPHRPPTPTRDFEAYNRYISQLTPEQYHALFFVDTDVRWGSESGSEVNSDERYAREFVGPTESQPVGTSVGVNEGNNGNNNNTVGSREAAVLNASRFGRNVGERNNYQAGTVFIGRVDALRYVDEEIWAGVRPAPLPDNNAYLRPSGSSDVVVLPARSPAVPPPPPTHRIPRLEEQDEAFRARQRELFRMYQTGALRQESSHQSQESTPVSTLSGMGLLLALDATRVPTSQAERAQPPIHRRHRVLQPLSSCPDSEFYSNGRKRETDS